MGATVGPVRPGVAPIGALVFAVALGWAGCESGDSATREPVTTTTETSEPSDALDRRSGEELAAELDRTDLAVEAARTGAAIQVTVTNHGPNPATDAFVAIVGAERVVAEPAGVACRDDAGQISCELGELPARQRRVIELAGPGEVRIDVGYRGEDTDPSSNSIAVSPP